jgi:hypothetical protein
MDERIERRMKRAIEPDFVSLQAQALFTVVDQLRVDVVRRLCGRMVEFGQLFAIGRFSFGYEGEHCRNGLSGQGRSLGSFRITLMHDEPVRGLGMVRELLDEGLL